MSDRRPFNFRGFTSFVILLGFSLCSLSGFMLYLSPKGRVANWSGWTMLGYSKVQWEDLHLIMTFTFFVGALFHLYFNWSYLMRYLRDLMERGLSSKRELALAAVVILVIFVGTHLGLPPFGTVIALGEDVKDYWEVNSPSMPYAHAEESTVADFAKRMGVDVNHVLDRFREKGFEAEGPDAVIGEIAASQGKTPAELFKALQQSPGTSGAGMGQGSGMGQRPLTEVCAAQGIELEAALTRLRSQGVEATAEMKLREIAQAAGKMPIEVLALLKDETTGF